MSSNFFFQIATSAVFLWLGTYDVCASMQKDCGTDFGNFDFKIFGEFLK